MNALRALALAALLGGCSGRTELAPTHPYGPIVRPSANAFDARSALHAVQLASVAPGTYGPYVGSGAAGTVLVWAEARKPDAASEWYALPFDPAAPSASATREPKRLTVAASELGAVAVRAAGPKPARGDFLVVNSFREGALSFVTALRVSPRGALVHDSMTLARLAASEVLWVDALPSPRGTLVLWAARERADADVYGVEVDARGKLLGAPQKLARDALAWQVAPLPGGFALGTVQAAAAHRDRGLARIDFWTFGANAPNKTVPVTAEPTVGLDFDMVRLANGKLFLAWSDASDIEEHLFGAVLSADGALLAKPAQLAPSFGEQALVALVPPDGDGPAFIAWESYLGVPGSGQALELAALDASGALGSEHTRLAVDAPGAPLPEFVASGRGLVALTSALPCPRSGPCSARERVPTVVKLGRQLDVVSSRPLELLPLRGQAPSLAWGLTCKHARCFTLATVTRSPAPIFAMDVSANSTAWQPAAVAVKQTTGPRARALEAVAALDPVADVAATAVGQVTLAAWVSYFDPSIPWQRLKKPLADGRSDPLRARLEVRAFGADGAAQPAELISQRARSVGGVALASDTEHHAALLAWSAEDNKQPQVFITLLDEGGRRLKQKMLTHQSGEVSDVAVATTPGGFVVGWIDERSGEPEVYATSVARTLERAAPEQRITATKGAATSLALLSRDDSVLAAWADARDPARPGFSDVYVARLRARDASPLGRPRPVAETRANSHSPVLAARGSTALLAWIEEALPEERTPGAVRVVALDAEGRAGEPLLVSGLDGEPLSVALDCVSESCRLLIAVDLGETAELEAVDLARPGDVLRLARLDEGAAQTTPPVLVGSQIFYADLAGPQLGRVRRMVLDWQ